VIQWLKKKYLAKTPRAVRNVEAPGPYKFATFTATHLLVFMITLTYSTLAPFILIFAVIYFALVYVTARYNLLYVYIPNYEAGGFLFPSLFKRLMSILLIYQLVLVYEFGIYKFVAGAVISGVVAIATVVYWIFLRKTFGSARGEILSGFAAKIPKRNRQQNQNQNVNAVPSAPAAQDNMNVNGNENVAVNIPQVPFLVDPTAYEQPSLKEPQPLSELPGDIEASRKKNGNFVPTNYGSGNM